MTRDRHSDGLSGTDQLLHAMIRDNAQAIRQLIHLVSRLMAQGEDTRGDLLHLSTQFVGMTERLWRLETERKMDKPEGVLWQTWDLFTRKQIAFLLIAGLLVLLGILEPKDAQNLLRTMLGLPPV